LAAASVRILVVDDFEPWRLCLRSFLQHRPALQIVCEAAGSKRPAHVPSDYVITPFGYMHPSCVRQLKDGETLLADGRVQFADGTEQENSVSCSYPRYSPLGERVSKDSGGTSPREISWSWIKASQVATTTTYNAVTATWTVPPTPTTNDGQTLFFFPSLSHHNLPPPSEEPIIQPVLGYNDGQSGVGPWNIASWNCCPNGMVWNSTPVTVHTGDQILGTVQSACGNPTIQACSKWNITTQDLTSRQSTTLHVVFPSLLTFPWAQSGVLEVYNILQCSDFPPDGSITFSNISLFDNLFRRVQNPGWSPMLFVNQGMTTPWCNYDATTTNTTTTLTY
jgi:hypothetical protein